MTLNGKEPSEPCKGCVVGLGGSFALFLTARSGQRRSWSLEECTNLVGYTCIMLIVRMEHWFSPVSNILTSCFLSSNTISYSFDLPQFTIFDLPAQLSFALLFNHFNHDLTESSPSLQT